VNFLSTFSDKKSCNTSTTLLNSAAQLVSELLVFTLSCQVAKLFERPSYYECGTPVSRESSRVDRCVFGLSTEQELLIFSILSLLAERALSVPGCRTITVPVLRILFSRLSMFPIKFPTHVGKLTHIGIPLEIFDQKLHLSTRNTFCRTRSLSNATSSFFHTRHVRVCIARTMPWQDVCCPSVRPSVTRRYCV